MQLGQLFGRQSRTKRRDSAGGVSATLQLQLERVRAEHTRVKRVEVWYADEALNGSFEAWAGIAIDTSEWRLWVGKGTKTRVTLSASHYLIRPPRRDLTATARCAAR